MDGGQVLICFLFGNCNIVANPTTFDSASTEYVKTQIQDELVYQQFLADHNLPIFFDLALDRYIIYQISNAKIGIADLRDETIGSEDS